MPKALVVLRYASIAALILGVVQIGFTTLAHSRDIEVRYLQYSNCGAYTVKLLNLVWKEEGEKRQRKKLAANIKGNPPFHSPKNNMYCFDLTSQDIPVGSEVWLEYKIEAGSTENCKKSNPRIYSDSSKLRQGYKSKGETYTNNSCKLTDRDGSRVRNARIYRPTPADIPEQDCRSPHRDCLLRIGLTQD